MLVYLQIVRWQIHNMKKRIKYLIIIFCLFAFCNITYHSLKSASLKKDCSTHIDLAIQVDEKYRNEPSDANRNKYIMELKKLVVAYSKLRDFEKGNKKCNIKLLVDYLSSSYDILEVDKDRVYQLSDLRHGLRFLKSDLYDESGSASDSFLTFIKANS